jgi:hypothetical protein
MSRSVVDEHRGRRRTLVACAAVGVVVAVAVVAFAPSLYEVVRSGRDLVPYSSTYLYEVRILDAITLYATVETRPSLDKLSAVALVASGTMSFTAFLLLRAARAEIHLQRFFAFGSAGLAFLAADELFGIHELLGHNLRFLADLPGVTRPDDVVFALYALPLAVFAWTFRDILRSHRTAVQLLGVGLGFFAVAVVGDIMSFGVDEPAEGLAAACLLAALVAITATILRRELDLDGIAALRAGPAARGSDLSDDDSAAQGRTVRPAGRPKVEAGLTRS